MSSQMYFLFPQILCTVDLTKCGPYLPNSGDACDCLRNRSHSYDFYVKRTTFEVKYLSNVELEAEYYCSDVFACDTYLITVPLGKLPPMFCE